VRDGPSHLVAARVCLRVLLCALGASLFSDSVESVGIDGVSGLGCRDDGERGGVRQR
jgi:hypothetical protein